MRSLLRFIPFYHRKQAAEQAKRDAMIRRLTLQPTMKVGSVIYVNPCYRGETPYLGPEVFDPENKGRRFIVVRPENHPPRPADSNPRVRWS